MAKKKTADVKTKPTGKSVTEFLAGVEPKRRAECKTLVKLMREVTGSPPKLWGPGIVGFGSYHYEYASGREGDWPLAGFSPRKQALTLYIMSGFPKHAELMKKLGRYKTGKACLYIKSLDDVDMGVLKKLVKASVDHVRKTFP